MRPRSRRSRLQSHGWQLGRRSTIGCWRPSTAREASFSPIRTESTSKTGDPVVPRSAASACALHARSASSSAAAPLLDATLASDPGEVALPARTWQGLARSSGGGEIQRVISTDCVGAFAELRSARRRPAGRGIPPRIPAPCSLIAALPPHTLWSHLTAPGTGRRRQGADAGPAAGAPGELVAAADLVPIKARLRCASAGQPPVGAGPLPRPLLALCADLVESNQGLSAEVCALAPDWHAVG